MKNSFSFRRAIWLIEYLLEVKESTMVDINSAWCRSGYGDNLPADRKTWQRNIKEIADAFGIDIECTPIGSHVATYSIVNPTVVKSNTLIRWMINCLHFKFHLLDCLDISNRIMLEDFPSDNGNFIPIKNAMKNNIKIEFNYRPYGKKEIKHHRISPYCIKTYKHRCYVLGRFDSGFFCVFSFDRMMDLAATNQDFIMPSNFDAKEFFNPFYGVFVGTHDLKIENIIIRAYDDAPDYLNDVPIHHSQTIVSSCDEYTDFQFNLYPTKDFLGAILQQGNRLEVMEPEWLRQNMYETISNMAARYTLNGVSLH